MYKSYRMSNTEQVATVGPQMVAGIRYRNEVAAATSHNHAYRAVVPVLWSVVPSPAKKDTEYSVWLRETMSDIVAYDIKAFVPQLFHLTAFP